MKLIERFGKIALLIHTLKIVSLAELFPQERADHFIRKTAGFGFGRKGKQNEKKNALKRASVVPWHEMILAASALYMHRMTGADMIIVLGLPVMMRLGSCALHNTRKWS
ncbi:hypothetical protein BSAF29S_03571 [Bacillus safensis subsp. safensis]